MNTRTDYVSFVLRMLGLLLALGLPVTHAQAEQEHSGAIYGALHKRFFVEGSTNAPVEVTVFFSPTTPPASGTFAAIRQQLVDTYVSKGLLRIRYQEVSFDEPSLRYSAILHCVLAEQYLTTVSTIFSMESATPPQTKELDHYISTLWTNDKIDTDWVANKCLASVPLHEWMRKESTFAKRYVGIRKERTPVYVFSNSPFRLDREAALVDFNTVMQALLQRSAQTR